VETESADDEDEDEDEDEEGDEAEEGEDDGEEEVSEGPCAECCADQGRTLGPLPAALEGGAFAGPGILPLLRVAAPSCVFGAPPLAAMRPAVLRTAAL